MDRRRFLLGAAPAVLGAGVGAVGAAGPVASAPRIADVKATGAAAGRQEVLWSTTAPGAWLTFDDGPDPELTPKVLDVLRAHAITATFVVIGAFAARHLDLLRRIVDEGHDLGNHTWSHPGLHDLPPAEVRAELERTHELLSPLADVHWFRPPRGLLSGAALQVAAELGYGVLMWSAVDDDPIEPGSLVVKHDGLGRASFAPGSGDAVRMRTKRRRQVGDLDAALRAAVDRGVEFRGAVR